MSRQKTANFSRNALFHRPAVKYYLQMLDFPRGYIERKKIYKTGCQ